MLFDLLKSLDKKVEEDKKNLVADLKLADIETLIIQMDNNKPISNNIIKLQQRDKTYSSEDSPSWFAYRISDELCDTNLKPDLLRLLKRQDFEKYKKYTLRCLSSLCVNTKDYELFNLIISEISQIDDEVIVGSVVSRLCDLQKPKTLDIEYLKTLLKEGSYQNRIDALRGLQNCEHTEIEELLITEFKISDQHTKGMICATLRTTGTEKCFEVLDTEFKKTRSNNLKYYIESAKTEIKERQKICSQH